MNQKLFEVPRSFCHLTPAFSLLILLVGELYPWHLRVQSVHLSSYITSFKTVILLSQMKRRISQPECISEYARFKNLPLIDVVLTTNENIVNACQVMSSTISDHSLVCVTLKLKAPKPRCTYITVRSYKNYTHTKFIEDLPSVPFYTANIFDDLDDHVYVFNSLFLDVLNDHAPVKRVKIKSRPNPFITPEI